MIVAFLTIGVRGSEIFTRGSGAGPMCGFGMSRCEDKREEYASMSDVIILALKHRIPLELRS